jgi:hypothetical protein
MNNAKTDVRSLFESMMIEDNARKNAENIADIVYYDHLDSDDGKKMWDSDFEEQEEKVDHIFDAMMEKYVYELDWMNENEWDDISDALYSKVHAGVF